MTIVARGLGLRSHAIIVTAGLGRGVDVAVELPGAGSGSAGRRRETEPYFRPWEDFPLIHNDQPAEKIARKLRVVAERQAKTGVAHSERLAQAASVIGEIKPDYASAWLEYYRAAYTKALDAALRRELAIQRAIMDAQDDEALALLLLEC